MYCDKNTIKRQLKLVMERDVREVEGIISTVRDNYNEILKEILEKLHLLKSLVAQSHSKVFAWHHSDLELFEDGRIVILRRRSSSTTESDNID